MINDQEFYKYIASGLVCQSLFGIDDKIKVEARCSYNGTIAPALPASIITSHPYIWMNVGSKGTIGIYACGQQPTAAISYTKLYNGIELPTHITAYQNNSSTCVLVFEDETYKMYEFGDKSLVYDEINGVFISDFVCIDNNYYIPNSSNTGWTSVLDGSASHIVYPGEPLTMMSTNVVWTSKDIMDTVGNVYASSSALVDGSYDRVIMYYQGNNTFIKTTASNDYAWKLPNRYNNIKSWNISRKDCVWANYDIITENGDVWLAASDPIPVHD